MFEFKRYSPDDARTWDDFVAASRQPLFLFLRGYMDYHRKRFADHSLMILREGRLCALLPANAADDGTLWSHQGLTYGGLVTGSEATAAGTLDLMEELNTHLAGEGFRRVVYKPVPWIYCRQPAQEDLYAVTQVCHASLCVRNLSATVDMGRPVKWRHDRHYNANKAARNGIVVEQDNGALPEFWDVLDGNLMATYHARPVHSLDEMRLLAEAFPRHIRLYVARWQGRVVGGVLVYVLSGVVHTQYISASAEGKRLHAVDALVRTIMDEWRGRCRYFDFGTSNEDHGRALNRSLIAQKEGFGGRGVCYDWYAWDL